jgi:hypothetical protein
MQITFGGICSETLLPMPQAGGIRRNRLDQVLCTAASRRFAENAIAAALGRAIHSAGQPTRKNTWVRELRINANFSHALLRIQ